MLFKCSVYDDLNKLQTFKKKILTITTYLKTNIWPCVVTHFFFFWFSETGFLCIALAVLELTL
jgi:hypothetical protein